jgi:hypothetical protein
MGLLCAKEKIAEYTEIALLSKKDTKEQFIMSVELREFSRINATGIGEQDGGDPDMRNGVLDQRVPASIVATGTADRSYRRGYSLDSASRMGRGRSGSR